MKMAALPGFLAAVLLLAGCSEDRATPASASPDGKRVVTALTPGLTDATLGVTTADAACAVARLVDQVGVQRLVQAGVVTPELTPTTRALADSELGAAVSEARSSCLEDKVATAIATAITTSEGLFATDQDATCVARAFTGSVGLDRLLSGQVVDKSLGYVENGALQDSSNARAFGEAVVGCLGADPASRRLTAIIEAGYTAGSAAVARQYASCFLPEFVKQVGVPALFGNRFVTDQGEYAYQGRVYDTAAATALAGAILGCVDTLKADARAAAEGDPGLDAAALEACAKAAISPTFLRDEFLVNQLLGRVAAARAAAKTSERAFQRCLAAQR